MAGCKFLVINKQDIAVLTGWLFIAVILVLFPANSQAKIADGLSCSDCHTMHNSQDGTSLTMGTAEQALLNNSCAGCHTGTNNPPPTIGDGPAPFVFDSSLPNYGVTGTTGDTLAGGNFYWVADTTDTDMDRKGHNVVGITTDDALFGVGGTEPVPGTATNLANQLTCAGANGCHGNGAGTDIESLMPAHHSTDDATLGDSVANSFRFLSGIKGLEDADWQFTVSDTDHNQYQGSIGAAAGTITSFCSACHGDFHATGTTPFLRHPTDVNMPNAGEYASYYSYRPIAPVASATLPATPYEEVRSVADSAIVTCISCHRAHGTPWDAMLRWDYKSWPGGGYNGCAECHSSKN